MDRTPVTSSNIVAIGYDPDSRTMHVEFRGADENRVYAYSDVEPATHAALMSADSIGAHFHRHVRSSHDSERIS